MSEEFWTRARKRASLAHGASPARLTSVMSRETPNVPISFPSLSRKGILVEETQRTRPSP